MSRLAGPRKARFETLFKNGAREAGILVRACSLPGSGYVGIATGKRIGGKPQRNHAKRRLRQAVMESGGAIPGLDLVLIVGESAAQAPYTDLKSDWLALRARTLARWPENSP